MEEQYQAIQSERLYEKIVGQIEQRILSGDLKLGEQLPPEREMAEQFRVSRTAVREAVKALSEKGLVEIRPGRGTFVINSVSRAVRHSIVRMMKISLAESPRDLVEFREIFEPEMAALAAQRAGEEQIAAIREAVNTMDACLDDADLYLEADLDFHLALAEATQNVLIPFLIDSIVDLLREQRTAIFHIDGAPQRGQHHHKRILEAIIHRDPAAARLEMQEHLRQVRADNPAN